MSFGIPSYFSSPYSLYHVVCLCRLHAVFLKIVLALESAVAMGPCQ